MRGLSERRPWMIAAVGAMLLSTLAGCQGGTASEGASDPETITTSEIAQLGGRSSAESAELAFGAFAAGDCTRLREVAPGWFTEGGECAGVVASNGPDLGVELLDIEERVDGDVAVVDADEVVDGSVTRVQVLVVDTVTGWLVVASAEDGTYAEVPDLGVPGTVTDALRALVEASRAEDCDAYLKVYPGEIAYECRRMESTGLDQVSEIPSEPGSPVVTANVALIEGETIRTREVMLVRTVEDRWIIAGFVT